jgi:hypothetical protein
MNTDAVFYQGSAHHVCQDYALASPGKACLSDGCSSTNSKQTDFGARLLCAHSLQQPGIQRFIFNAADTVDSLQLPLSCLDGTLLQLYSREGKGYSFVQGDGVVAARKRSGGWTAILSEYQSGAPFYPSYRLSSERTARYMREFPEPHIVTLVEDGLQVDKVQITPGDHHPYLEQVWDSLEYDILFAVSDGIHTFQTENRGVSLHWETVVAEILQVKSTEGVFLQRRINRMLKNFRAQGIRHTDDFSAIGLTL